MGFGGLKSEIINRSTPFSDIRDFSNLINEVKDKKVVMLGESSHGTKEFYEWRSLISAELVREHGFNFIAVEGDWPPCEEVNRFIRHKNHNGIFQTLGNFTRWPSWMWANMEVASMLDWLREWNQGKSPEEMAGFHGLDVYSFYESIDAVLKVLWKNAPHLAQRAKEYYSCLDSYRHDEKAYAKSLFQYPEGCEQEIAQALEEISRKKMPYFEQHFDAVQNAKIVKNAERYYRAMVLGEDDSWNVRDGHMMETLESLLNHYGPGAKGIIWEHNTHIGDYRATDMSHYNQVNIGGLAREKLGADNVALIGFATYEGDVIASHSWDGPVEVMKVPPGKIGSLEAVLHESIPSIEHDQFWIDLKNVEQGSPLLDYRGHRAIGVIYDPDHERGNYVPTKLASRYDALVFIDKTTALTPLKVRVDEHKIPETYPSAR